MSSDPERLLHGESLAPVERDLLASVRNVAPPEGAKDRAWQEIAGRIAAGVVVGGAAAGASAATAKAGIGSLVTSSLAVKSTALLVAGGVVVGGYLMLEKPAAPSAQTVVSPVHAREAAPRAVPTEPKRDEALVAPSGSGNVSPRRSSETASGDQLTAESAALAEARSRLRAGDATGAEAILSRMSQRFPRGVLNQEREVLTIEVLDARGQTAAAKARARAFVRAHPKSPHSEKLRRSLDEP
jgi:hypothetical protein